MTDSKTSKVVIMTPPVKKGKLTTLEIWCGYIVLVISFSILWSSCSALFSTNTNVPTVSTKVEPTAEEYYDSCVLLHMELENASWTEADNKCDYLR